MLIILQHTAFMPITGNIRQCLALDIKLDGVSTFLSYDLKRDLSLNIEWLCYSFIKRLKARLNQCETVGVLAAGEL